MRIYDYLDYKRYLGAAYPTGGKNHGSRATLARYLRCQPAFISQVLKGSGHLSLEHAHSIGKHLNLDRKETDYLLILIQYSRAGTPELKRHFKQRLDELRQATELIENQVKSSGEIAKEDRELYYSSWHYAAIHVMTSVSALQSPAALAEHLGLPIPAIKEYLALLVKAGIIDFDGSRYRPSARRLHLGQEASQLARHHINWRLRAIADLDKRSEESLHFSSILSLSERDAKKIRAIFLQAIVDQEAIMVPSPEEAVFSLCLDFFRL